MTRSAVRVGEPAQERPNLGEGEPGLLGDPNDRQPVERLAQHLAVVPPAPVLPLRRWQQSYAFVVAQRGRPHSHPLVHLTDAHAFHRAIPRTTMSRSERLTRLV